MRRGGGRGPTVLLFRAKGKREERRAHWRDVVSQSKEACCTAVADPVPTSQIEGKPEYTAREGEDFLSRVENYSPLLCLSDVVILLFGERPKSHNSR